MACNNLISDTDIKNIYINKSHGSLKLTLEATKKYDEPIDFIRSIYNDIENEEIDPFKFTDKEQQYRYQTIVKNLNDLNSQQRLKEFYVIIDGQELEVTKRKYLKEKIKHIYNEDIKIVGIFSCYKQQSNSFEIYSEGIGTLYCHLEELSKSNSNQYENIISILKKIDNFKINKLKFIGEKIKPKTISVTSLELAN
jgi:hypothetical protein